jgi:hypothetical protein
MQCLIYCLLFSHIFFNSKQIHSSSVLKSQRDVIDFCLKVSKVPGCPPENSRNRRHFRSQGLHGRWTWLDAKWESRFSLLNEYIKSRLSMSLNVELYINVWRKRRCFIVRRRVRRQKAIDPTRLFPFNFLNIGRFSSRFLCWLSRKWLHI